MPKKREPRSRVQSGNLPSLLRSLVATLVFVALTLSHVPLGFATVDPLSEPNNRIGIHITNEEDLTAAQNLVNTNGGDWGYVTLVIREDERRRDRWQAVFDSLRRRHLIPLVRIATKLEDGGWAKPRLADIDPWVDFLASLNWVTQNRYVILFNEPNHAQEWGGEVRSDEYALIVKRFHEKLKEQSGDFFILPAGFDAAAIDSGTSMEVSRFFREMYRSDSQIFTLFDGWTSHAYPNPDFSASPWRTGKASLTGYRWEVSFLSRFGLKPDIPIFITETGWKHREGETPELASPPAQKVAEFYTTAFQKVWTDANLVAITPFILNYPHEPFDHFSFSATDNSWYPQYEAVRALKKTSGSPKQHHAARQIRSTLPTPMVRNSTYTATVEYENTGQSIWTDQETTLSVAGTIVQEVTTLPLPYTEPYQTATVTITLRSPPELGNQTLTLSLKHKGQLLHESTTDLTVIPPPKLSIKAQLAPKFETSGDFTLLIYEYGNLIKKIPNLSIQDGEGKLEEVYDVVPGRVYRFVLLKPSYLPRQVYAKLEADETTVTFPLLVPVDLNADGSFTTSDVFQAIRHPLRTLNLLSPWSE